MSAHRGPLEVERAGLLAQLGRQEPFDVVVVGGGATGAGCALEAAARGLSVCLVERGDFGSGTSSRSTKLIHGGVRYLELAVRGLEPEQLKLVHSALKERAILHKLAPHLTQVVPILVPLYRRRDVPYYRAGLKLYDWLAGGHRVASSHYLDSRETAQAAPDLKQHALRGAVVYHDILFDDARMNLALVLTAGRLGAVTLNYVEATGFVREGGRVRAVRVRDRESGNPTTVQARSVINACGPFVDRVRQLDDPAATPLLAPSAGVHIVTPRLFARDAGILLPQTEDRRMVFILPWMGRSVIGTTDDAAPLEEHPRASMAAVSYLLRHVNRHFDTAIQAGDVTATWSGLRPLIGVRANNNGTATIVRDHAVEVSTSGLVSIYGGKWTTYRLMAIDAVQHAIAGVAGITPPVTGNTDVLPLVGGDDWSGAEEMVRQLSGLPGVDTPLARHLTRTYGDQAEHVLAIAKSSRMTSGGAPRRLAEGYPILEAEVVYAARHEAARTVEDVLARRTRLAFLDTAAAGQVASRVAELMGHELGWSPQARREALQKAQAYL